MFSCKICKIFKNGFFREQLQWLLLNNSDSKARSKTSNFRVSLYQAIWYKRCVGPSVSFLTMLITLWALPSWKKKKISWLGSPFEITILTFYLPVLHFYTPGKHQRTVRFSDIFRRYRNLALRRNGSSQCQKNKLVVLLPKNSPGKDNRFFLMLKGYLR